MRFFVAAFCSFIFGLSVYAQSPLSPVYSQGSTTGVAITSAFSLDGNNLLAHYEVTNPALNDRPVLGPNQYPFQFDTIELFLSVNEAGANLPYYEFEVSPLNQTFLVKILDPKKPFINNFPVAGFTSTVTKTDSGWVADLSVPLDQLNWDGDVTKVTGNAYAITGFYPHRTYWGLTLPVEQKPNFHLPQYFQPLLPPPSAAN